MRRFALPALPALLAVLLASTTAPAQTGELNLLTDLGTPFPPGCLSIDLPEEPSDPDSLLVDSDINVPSALSNANDATVNVQIWRVACADDGYSVVLVRMAQVAGDPVVIPQVYAEAGDVDRPFHEANLLLIPASGNVGATGGIITNAGTTWMLAVEPTSIDGQTTFLPEDYNEQFTVEFTWEAYSGAQDVNFPVLLDRFEPSLDPPQFDEPVLNGRFTGQWVAEGRERQGLVLQVAETGDANFLFAIFFTYLDGAPLWVTGNTTAIQFQPGPISVDALRFDGGEFFADPNQPPASAIDATTIGEFTISVIDCNTIQLDYDFTDIGEGTGSLVLTRLVRVAGYDCNPWE